MSTLINEKIEQDFVIEGILELGELVAEKIGSNPCTNSGAVFENNLFSLRAYCWCEGSIPEHKDGCPVNFEYKNFWCSWYKHTKRCFDQSESINPTEWDIIFKNCIESLK